MEKIKYFLGNITLINIALAGLLIFLIKSAAAPVFHANVKYVLPAVKKTATETAQRDPKNEKGENKSPSPSDYMIIAEQNLFHPQRLIPVAKAEGPPLPQPEFVLYGTLITDGVQIAYLDDKKSGDKGNKGTQAKKQTALRVGDSMSGFVLKEVTSTQVVMQRGEEKVTVSLNQAKTRETPVSAAAAPAAPTGPGAAAVPAPETAAKQPTGPPQFPRRRQPGSQTSSAPPEQATTQQTITPPAGMEKGVNTFMDLFKKKVPKTP